MQTHFCVLHFLYWHNKGNFLHSLDFIQFYFVTVFCKFVKACYYFVVKLFYSKRRFLLIGTITDDDFVTFDNETSEWIAPFKFKLSGYNLRNISVKGCHILNVTHKPSTLPVLSNIIDISLPPLSGLKSSTSFELDHTCYKSWQFSRFFI